VFYSQKKIFVAMTQYILKTPVYHSHVAEVKWPVECHEQLGLSEYCSNNK